MNIVDKRPMGRPRKRPKGEVRRSTFRCTDAEFEVVSEAAELAGVTVNDLLLEAAIRYHRVLLKAALKQL